MSFSKTFQKTLFPIYFLLLILVSVYTYFRPAYNPDMIPYMAIARGIDASNYQATHASVYKDAKIYLPALAYSNLTDQASPPVLNMYHNPDRLYQLAPQHAVKPLYIASIRFFEAMGFNPVKATLIPGILSFLVIGLLVFKWIKHSFDPLRSFLFSVPLMCSAPLLSTLKLSTPDMMAAALFLVGVYILLEKMQIVLSAAFLLLSIYTRIDFLIPVFLLLTLLFFRNNFSLNIFLALIMILGIAYFSILLIVGDYGWNILFFLNFPEIHKQEFRVPGASYHFLNAIAAGFFTALGKTHMGVFVFIGLIPFALTEHRDWFKWKAETMIILMLFIAIIIRSLLHPYFLDRFFIAYYLLSAIIALKVIHKSINSSQFVETS